MSAQTETRIIVKCENCRRELSKYGAAGRLLVLEMRHVEREEGNRKRGQKMSGLPVADYQLDDPSMDSVRPVEEIASEVAMPLTRRLSAKDIARLLQIVFLEADEAAELLRVETKTIRAWVSQEKIPYRKANGRVIFMLAELLQWTLPEDDRHARHRLAAATACNIAVAQLAAAGKE